MKLFKIWPFIGHFWENLAKVEIRGETLILPIGRKQGVY
jgi:hypothetical protein